MEAEAIVTIENMYKSFDGVMALRGVNFKINKGEMRCLAGENGSGKSTLIKIISGFYTYDKGKLEINGREYKHLTPNESIAEGIQVIYQDFALFPNLTIAENIAMYQTVREKSYILDKDRIRDIAQQAMEKVHYSIDLKKYVYELNVAEKQMVAICRAIVLNARLLIMDEPTTALTKPEVEKLFAVTRTLKDHGVSTLFVTHKLNEVYEICDCVTIMRNGQNVFESQKNETIPTQDEMIYHMTGKRVENRRYDYHPTSKQPLLAVQEYTLPGSFENISMKVYSGEIVAITGLLGCGRNELAESLFGVIPAQSGKILFKGKDLGIIKNVQMALANNIAYVPDDRLTKGLHLDHSISYNALSRVITHLAGPAGILNAKKVEEKKKACFNSIHIPNLIPQNPAKSLSGGNQQKLVLMKWLAATPDLLILNSPTVGVDVGSKSEIHRIIMDLAANQHIAVLVISDDIFEIMQICNRAYVMDKGRIVNELEISETTSDDLENLILNSNQERNRETTRI